MNKKLLLFFVYIFATSKAFAQADTLSFDVLTIPNSPGFNLLSITPTQVERPTSGDEFTATILNNTGNLSKLPSNFAIEMKPFSVFSRKTKEADKWVGERNQRFPLGNNIVQSLTLSCAFTSDSMPFNFDKSISNHGGFGMKVSIFRGDVHSDSIDIKTLLDSLYNLNTSLTEARITLLRSSPEFNRLRIQEDSCINLMILNSKIIEELEELKRQRCTECPKLELRINALNNKNSELNVYLDSTLAPAIESLMSSTGVTASKNYIREFTNLKNLSLAHYTKRSGLLMDLAGGTVLGFRNNDYDNSIIQKNSIWLNTAYAWQQAEIGFLVRYSFNRKILAESGILNNTYVKDFGIRLTFTSNNQKFTFSLEGMLRTIKGQDTFQNNIMKELNCYNINLSYQIAKSQAVTFTFGKSVNEIKGKFGGNLIAALGYVTTFGDKKKILD